MSAEHIQPAFNLPSSGSGRSPGNLSRGPWHVSLGCTACARWQQQW